jgi:hypothetical protein
VEARDNLPQSVEDDLTRQFQDHLDRIGHGSVLMIISVNPEGHSVTLRTFQDKDGPKLQYTEVGMTRVLTKAVQSGVKLAFKEKPVAN